MKVTYTNRGKSVRFSDLKPGDCFTFAPNSHREDSVAVCVEECADGYNAVSLENGIRYRMYKDTLVTPLDAEVIVKPKS